LKTLLQVYETVVGRSNNESCQPSAISLGVLMRIIWRFRAKSDRLEEFRRVYGSDGAWARLFARSPEYRGTELLQDMSDSVQFVVIDSWRSRDAFERFRKGLASEYAALDSECLELTEEEIFIGRFEVLD
jgi:heme-degrading monooxygenase HmoA